MKINTKAASEVFFTIVIPTRERKDTLVHALATALSQDYQNYEVLVSDNASLDGTQEMVSDLKAERLRYINTGRRVSMSENWEFALSHVKPGWVTFLGDDDAILPGALKIVNEIIAKTGAQAVRSNGCNYGWPGISNPKYGSLLLRLSTGYNSVAGPS